MPGLIDCHLHLVYPERAEAAWMPEVRIFDNRTFTFEDFDTLAGRSAIRASVFMEVDVREEHIAREAEKIAELIADPKVPVVAQIAACRPEHAEGFDGWIARADELSIVGYRRILHAGVPDGLSRSETFRHNVRKVGRIGRTFDICVFARQLDQAVELIDDCPGTFFVLDHCGNPDVAAGEREKWRAGIEAVAKRGNVVAKMSGILANCAPGKAGGAEVRPYLEELIEVFGPKRIVWGSDWPVVETRSTLAAWTAITERVLGQLSPADRAAIEWDNAVRVYKLAPRLKAKGIDRE